MKEAKLRGHWPGATDHGRLCVFDDWYLSVWSQLKCHVPKKKQNPWDTVLVPGYPIIGEDLPRSRIFQRLLLKDLVSGPHDPTTRGDSNTTSSWVLQSSRVGWSHGGLPLYLECTSVFSHACSGGDILGVRSGNGPFRVFDGPLAREGEV